MTELSVIRKTTHTYTLTFTRNGVVQNITGWTIFFTVKKNTSLIDTSASISKTITAHTDAVNGISQISLSSSDTDIPQGTYVYDITYIDTSNNRVSIPSDNFVVLDYITQRSV